MYGEQRRANRRWFMPSIGDCNADLLAGLRGERSAETTGADNIKTGRLVFGAYAAARA
jgi:hypothetical protein